MSSLSEQQQQQLSEYESQLSELNALLEEDPNDESILQLKRDLLELIELTKSGGDGCGDEDAGDGSNAGAGAAVSNETTKGHVDGGREKEGVAVGLKRVEEDNEAAITTSTSATISTTETATATTTNTSTTTTTNPKKSITKKKSKSKHSSSSNTPTTFEIPTHLIPLDSDTAAEKNRKRRTIKALKSKFKERQKQKLSEEKQKSWQDFTSSKKVMKTKSKKKSIFATEEGVHAKVGVISGVSGEARRVTEFGERRRHK